jgi:hypothetical protein
MIAMVVENAKVAYVLVILVLKDRIVGRKYALMDAVDMVNVTLMLQLVIPHVSVT